MKRFIFTILFFNLIIATSCSNNDDKDSPDNVNYEELIVGSWKWTNVIVNGQMDNSPCAVDWRYVFGDNGEFSEGPFDGSICGSSGQTGIYSVSDNVISIIAAFSTVELVVDTINESEFVFDYNLLDDMGNIVLTKTISCQKIVN